MSNQTIARILMDYARLLSNRHDNVYRCRAYRRAAETLLRLERPVAAILEQEGRQGLEALPTIGPHLAYTIEGLVRTGQFRTLTEEIPRPFPSLLGRN